LDLCAILGTWLASKEPTERTPPGHGRQDCGSPRHGRRGAYGGVGVSSWVSPAPDSDPTVAARPLSSPCRDLKVRKVHHGIVLGPESHAPPRIALVPNQEAFLPVVGHCELAPLALDGQRVPRPWLGRIDARDLEIAAFPIEKVMRDDGLPLAAHAYEIAGLSLLVELKKDSRGRIDVARHDPEPDGRREVIDHGLRELDVVELDPVVCLALAKDPPRRGGGGSPRGVGDRRSETLRGRTGPAQGTGLRRARRIHDDFPIAAENA